MIFIIYRSLNNFLNFLKGINWAHMKHGSDVDPFEIFKIFFNKWYISITNI
jgi:hypothetical protein